MSIIAALLIASAPVNEEPVYYPAVREMLCEEHSGSGFIIADGIVATALHVAEGTACKDTVSGELYTTYATDPEHDFALMSGETHGVTPMKYACTGYIAGLHYMSYGITDFGDKESYYRSVPAEAKRIVDIKVENEDGSIEDFRGIWRMWGFLLPGMSGGPVTKAGVAYGINNTGVSDIFGNPMGPMGSYALKDTILCN